MKILLASLMCLVLTAVQSFALRGGPPYPGSTNLVGTYSGVMQGAFDPTNPASSNSIGIFTLGVPSSGNASGAFVMFSRGRVFTGTAQASADPQRASLRGILSATFNYTLSTLITDPDGSTRIETIPVTASARGPIAATVSTSRSRTLSGSSTTIMRGDASLNISQGRVAPDGSPVITDSISLIVSGVKQSNTATTSSSG